MLRQKSFLRLLAGLAIVSIVAGCIVSGTFVIVADFDFTASGDFYFHRVDITDDATWQDHKDDIDFIDAVGAEFYITSTEGTDVTFNVYVDDYTTGPDPITVPTSASKIITDFTVPNGTTKITYKQSLSILTNLERLKTLAKKGMFDYYATTTGTVGSTFVIDSAKIIVTISASK
ncbi:MAG: hypothetical protein R3F48_15490 [Candidatus Zixiibacteriota bacterium]